VLSASASNVGDRAAEDITLKSPNLGVLAQIVDQPEAASVITSRR
jgi:hypothetical protein